MEKWIVDFISLSGDETSWIEGHGVINKGSLTFDSKF